MNKARYRLRFFWQCSDVSSFANLFLMTALRVALRIKANRLGYRRSKRFSWKICCNIWDTVLILSCKISIFIVTSFTTFFFFIYSYLYSDRYGYLQSTVFEFDWAIWKQLSRGLVCFRYVFRRRIYSWDAEMYQSHLCKNMWMKIRHKLILCSHWIWIESSCLHRYTLLLSNRRELIQVPENFLCRPTNDCIIL